MSVVLPCCSINECRRRLLQPLYNAHREPHSNRVAHRAKPLYLMLRAVELRRQRLPCQSAFQPPRAHCLSQSRKIPPEAFVSAGDWQDRSVFTGLRRREKALGNAPKPSQNEECVLASAIATFCNTGQRRRADRVITATPVQYDGLIPNLGGDLRPTEPAIHALRVHRRI